MAAAHGRPALAVTFEPHPRDFFSPNTPQFRLTDEAGKLRLLAGTGLDGAVVMTFDKARAGTTAQDFIHHDLIERLGISGIAVGYDFHFGKGRVGSPSLLVSEAPRLGIEVDVQPHVDIDGAAGFLQRDPHGARGRPDRGRHRHARRSLVRHGRGDPWRKTRPRSRLSHRQYPARQELRSQARHLCGAGRRRQHKRFDAVASFGRRPTFDNGAPLLEMFLFDFKGDLYGKMLDVAFIAFIRDELKFDGVDALVRQMDDDSAKARAALAAAPGAFPKLGQIDASEASAAHPRYAHNRSTESFNAHNALCDAGATPAAMESRHVCTAHHHRISGPASA